MGNPIKRLAAYAAIDPEERVLAGKVGGWMYALGGITVSSFLLLPGLGRAHWAWMVGLAAVATGCGLIMALCIDWPKAPTWLIHALSLVSVGLVAGVVASSGGHASPGWIYLLFVVVFAGYFHRPAVAAVYIVGCMIVQALPLIYDPHSGDSHYIAELVIVLPSFAVLGATISLGKGLMRKLRARAELLAAEQAALRRIATAVLQGEPSEAIYALVSREAAALLGGAGAGILRFESDCEAVVVGSWADERSGRYPPGRVVPFGPGSELDRARAGERPMRVNHYPEGSQTRKLGFASSIMASVKVGPQSWGVIAVAAGEPGLTDHDESQLMEFADLLASAIATLDDRAQLAAQASTDPLTGLANRRSLHERLAAEVSRGVRHDRTLSVVVLDVDNFKQVNDFSGHEAGDAMLTTVARCLMDNARVEDTLGRLGGDEFAWVMPETTREEALVATERARRLIAATCTRPYRITVSAGICDTRATEHAAELVRYADSALYWSKAHGRNRSWVFDAQLIKELAGPARIDLLERSNAVLGLQALARAIDAKDPATSQHSERVSKLAGSLALAAGWSPEKVMLLKEAALVHDVGKVGIPDAVLCKNGPLSGEELSVIREHAELSARIVEGVLAPDQVEWIRDHHEKADGSGYPQGLSEAEIPEGAALLAVADAWDVMTGGRPYSEPKNTDSALSECAELAGRQFTRTAIGALMKLHAIGDLDGQVRPVPPGTPLPDVG
ncbi:MAG TPA: diguanylate cyclase [Solirubrobacteraceae bacterium]|nr:diguanylate cyclase [Solirubrobacteraceae bacterium]